MAAYGHSHGSWEPDLGYVEGSLARLVEAALGQTPALPGVRDHAGFQCGEEFRTLADEVRFFAERGIPLDEVTVEAHLQPGEVLVFDNLVVAHGRRGVRRPGELHQRVFGHRSVTVPDQVRMRDELLRVFSPQATLHDPATRR